MNKSIFPAFVIILAFLILQACNGNNTTKTPTAKIAIDSNITKFLKNAIEGGLTGIKASELASSHSKNPRVTDLAATLVTEQTKTLESLKKIEAKNVVSSNEEISPAHSQAIDELSKKSGPDFDKTYTKMIIKDNEKALISYLGATQVKDSIIQVFAKKTLHTIQIRLDSARAINKDLK